VEAPGVEYGTGDLDRERCIAIDRGFAREVAELRRAGRTIDLDRRLSISAIV
jgi:hypothetical protein